MKAICKVIKIMVFAIGAFVILDFLFDFHNGVLTMNFKHIINDMSNFIKGLF
jgi:uncharacterized membrane protein (Fun14 family)